MSIYSTAEGRPTTKKDFAGGTASGTRKRIAFFGIFGIRNLGNECTLQAIAYNARKRFPDGEFFAISFDPKDTLDRHDLCAYPISKQNFSNVRPGRLSKFLRILFKRPFGEIRDWISAVKTLRGADLLVMTGTGMLTDYCTTAFGFPYHVFRWSIAGRIAGCKVRFAAVGVGPLYQGLSRAFVRRALKAADYRSYRDDFSRRRISSVFHKDDDKVFPDLAFSLPPSMFPKSRKEPGRIRVGLGIMDHRDVHMKDQNGHEHTYSTYLEKMCDFVEWLIHHGYQVRILQGDAAQDLAPKADLKKRLIRRGIQYSAVGIFDDDCYTVEELVDQLSEVDVVVSPRFHNLVLGLIMAIPPLSLSYDPKNDALLERFGLSIYRQEIFTFDVQLLIEQFQSIIEHLQEIKVGIIESVENQRAQLEAQYDLIFSGL